MGGTGSESLLTRDDDDVTPSGEKSASSVRAVLLGRARAVEGGCGVLGVSAPCCALGRAHARAKIPGPLLAGLSGNPLRLYAGTPPEITATWSVCQPSRRKSAARVRATCGCLELVRVLPLRGAAGVSPWHLCSRLI